MSQLEDLRRRVYGPGATEADRERYRRALADLLPAESAGERTADDAASSTVPAPASQVGASPRRRTSGRRRGAAVALITAALAAVATLGLLQSAPRAPRIPASAVAPAPTAVPVPAAARAEFVRRLDAGRSAGLATYIYDHPESRSAEVRTLIRAETEEHDGTGSRTVALHPSIDADTGGRLTVVLILAKQSEVTWHATRIAERQNLSRYTQEVAVRRGRPAAGAPATATVGYTGSAPTAVRIEAPAGVRWDVLAVFSN